MRKKEEYKFKWKNFFLHLHVVNRHRLKVLILCCRAGIIWRGLVHDLSKYAPVEFFEGVKYYSGNRSPIKNCKDVNGYSEAWLHHKGRNKHHYEYWYDYETRITSPVMPYKYFVEMVCDSVAAGMIYRGKKWTKEYQLTYWLKTKDYAKINPKMDKLLTQVYMDISRLGIKKVINKKALKKLYLEYTR